MRLARRWCTVVALGVATACGEGASGEKAVVIASGGDGDILFPLLWAQSQARVYTDLMFDKLADIGQGQNTLGDAGYEPRLARSWRWASDSLSVTFTLDPKARWHDGTPVRAPDVKFAFDLYTDPKVVSGPGTDMARAADSVTVSDSVTVTVWYKARSPEQFHSIVYNLVPLPAHLLQGARRDSLRASEFARQPVGNGPFRFVSWEKSTRLELAAFDDFARGRPRLDRVIFSITGDQPSAARAVLAGDADFVEMLTLDDIAEARRRPDVQLVPVRGTEYAFLAFNLRTPDGKALHSLFGGPGVRRALTMATDRATLVRSVYDTIAVPAIGPFSRTQWTADTTLRTIPFDRAAAARLLDSLGWTPGKDSIRARGGRPLAFSILVQSTSRARIRFAELLQQAFAAVGVKASVDAIDTPAFVQRLATHQFDASLFTWRTTPSPSGARQSWSSGAYQPGSPYNPGGYRSPAFDAQVDSGLVALDPTAARAHFRAAYQTAIDDAAAIWLYEPRIVAGASRRLVTGPMRPDAWWQSVSAWDVTGPARRAAGGAATKP